MIHLKVLAAALVFAAMESCGGQTLTASQTSGGQVTQGSEKTQPSDETVVTGVLTDEGVVCQAMKGDDGELYTFEVIPDGLKTGDRVSVVKSTTNFNVMSTCDQGQVLHWDSITLLTGDGTTQTRWDYKDL